MTQSENGISKYVNVIDGPSCQHDANQKYRGRVKLVSSLTEMDEATLPRTSIVVTSTFGNGAGEVEATNFAGQQRLLTIRRGQEQCVGCAVGLAHAISAIVVI